MAMKGGGMKDKTICKKCGKEFDKDGRKRICPDCRVGKGDWATNYINRVEERIAYLREGK
jgi:predicted amidophosphoribosyltransferase